MKKINKVLLISFFCILLIFFWLLITYYFLTKDAKLDKEKLIDYGNKITVCDNCGNEVINTSLFAKRKSVNLNDLNDYTVNAFIAAEDAKFYSHNGLNYKRILKAAYSNLISRSFKEGASTISQQLIKNTHLSSDKTIKRKLQEIKLTKKLEKNYSKNEILEMYLNTIYFGHSCYGLQSAANFYFDKNAEDLSLGESATLVGLLSSPNNYSPFKNAEKSRQRRNLVLKSMKNCNYIDENTYFNEIEKPIEIKKTKNEEGFSDYLLEVFNELENVDLNAYLLNDGCKIETYLNVEMQREIEKENYNTDNAVIIVDNKNSGVCAYKSTIGNTKRQPGSTIKPLLVYAPAIEEKSINTFTEILDEKINYKGYSPENYDKKYHGKVTVEESLVKSYNVPAVKILNDLGINTALKYANKMNLKIDESDKSLALALGGMKHGLTLKDICDAYSTFSNEGNYKPSNFIKKIYDKNGKIIYERKNYQNKVFSEGTCSLINQTLKNTIKTGTAKKLKAINYDLAVKTGTCGFSDGNTDAYSIGYTSEHTVGVWLGDKDYKKLKITGGNDCCEIIKTVLNKLYKTNKPKKLNVDLGLTEIEIDKEDYKNYGKIVIADEIAPKPNKLKVKVLNNNVPSQKSLKFTNPTVKNGNIVVDNDNICIVLCQIEYYKYIINREQNGIKKVIYDGIYKEKIYDTPKNGTYVYSVIPYYEYKDKKYFGKEYFFPAVNVGNNKYSPPQIKVPNLIYGDWFNE